MKHSKEETEDILKLIEAETKSSLKSKLVDNWVVAVAIIVAILFVFFLGKFDPLDAVKDDILLKGIVGTLALLGLSFFWYVIIATLSKEVKEKEHARVELDNFSNGLKILIKFQQEGENILGALNRAEALSQSIIITKEELAQQLSSCKNTNNLTIMASAVGLYPIFPLVLETHFKQFQSNFEIDFIGSNVRLSSVNTDSLLLVKYIFL